MKRWRHHLHAHPELGFEVHATARFVADLLRSWGIETHEGVGRTGVVGVLRGGSAGPSIGIRADMDALPMTEARALPHASRQPGRMHACGHDGHTVMLLGAAHALARDGGFSGTVNLIFQPAEEGQGGAMAMLADGLFPRFPCDAVYALHNSERPLGEVAVHDGTVAAAADRFDIVIHGRGGHAATPHLTIDPLPIAARLLLDIEALPGRLTNVISPAVVTVGSFHAGEAFNTIPDTARLGGTVRCFDQTVRRQLEREIIGRAKAIATMHGATAAVNYESPFAPTVNSPQHAAIVAKVAEKVVGAHRLVRNPDMEMGSEDFSFMLEQKSGCYFLLGQADEAHAAAAHDPDYDFNDALLPIGASIWVALARHCLPS
ncbi:amidohydrolase [Taklimakanibacter lacteus]|uniref:amidohydrolase n=1 Tax=Taklimakanibacter lacteus TaxID=2268456 RepID=UPI0034D502BA